MRRAPNKNISSTKASRSVLEPALSQGDPREITQSHHAVQISSLVLGMSCSLVLI